MPQLYRHRQGKETVTGSELSKHAIAGKGKMEGRRARDSSDSVEAPESKPSVAVETLPEGPRRRNSGQKRKAPSSLLPSAAGSSSATPKRLIKERNALNILPAAHNGPWTRARHFPGKLAAGSPQTPQDGVVAVDTPAVEAVKEIFVSEDPVKFGEESSVSPLDAPAVDEDFEAVRSRCVTVHVVPTSAGWFSWKKIHEVERHALPSFFNGQSESRTPEIYTEIRNFIMKKFHFDPQTPVEAKDLSDILVGDLGARKEVMVFLDHWGLINFHPFPHCIGDATGPEVEADKTSSSLNQLYQFEIAESLPSYVPKKLELSPPSVLPNLAPESSLLDDMMRPADPSVEFHCNSCSADCSRKRYHCQKQADFDLCADCYNNGKFGSGMTPADFIVMESAEGPGVSGRNWTDQETLLLLEALELFGENWNEIAEHVATKTKAQCIMHFLQMPIEDPFLEAKENANLNILEKTEPCLATMDTFPGNIPDTMDHDSIMSSDQPVSSPAGVSGRKHAEVDLSSETCSNFAIEALKCAFQAVGFTDEVAKPSSFAEAGNPVMTLAAFLAGLVDQDAVTISSRNSLKAISVESPGIQLVSRHCFILDDPPNDAKSPVPESVFATSGYDDGDGDVVKVESQLPTPNGSTILKNGTENSQPNVVSEHSEKKQLDSSSEVLTKSSTVKELNSFLPEDAATICFELSDDRPLPEEQTLQSDRKDATTFVEPGVPGISNSKDLEDLSGQGVDAPSMVKCVDDVKVSQKDKIKLVEQSSNPSLIDQVKQNVDLPKVAYTMPSSIDLEEKEPQLKNDAASTLDFDEVAVRDENKTFSPKNDRNISTIAGIPHNISSISRAAVSLLSAAAVKAKLLADQEEDQIRQLVACMMEKQLHKLEIKLAFFPEFENMIVRAKEQTERARQKLMNERSQIIAARLGYPQPSSRSYPTSLTNAKLSVGYGSMGIRPPSMTYQKPPPPRRP